LLRFVPRSAVRTSLPGTLPMRWRLNSRDWPDALRGSWPKRAALLAGAFAIVAWLSRDAIFGTPVEIVEATRGDIMQTVVASGRVATPQRMSVGAVITGWVTRIPVDEGQSVRRGDVLIVLDDRDLRAAEAQAEAAVAQAEARIRQLREVGLPAAEQGLVQAQANLVLARQQYERNLDLKAKGFLSQSALDDSKRNLDVAESQLSAARLQVQTNGPAGSDFLLAQSALQQARANLAMTRARLDQTIIRAPADGTLIGRDVEPGEAVQPGKELMVLAPVGETQIIVQIDEKNLSQLRVGQQAIASADAYPREHFAAELFYINPGIDALRGSVEVKLRVPQPPAYLRQDMTVSVDIEVARHANVVVVPSGAVADAAGKQPWVLTVEDHRARRRPVKLGIKGEGRVEVVEGVRAGERLVASASAGVVPDQRVRAAGARKSSPR
jgi:HlyD family secretion protein